MPIHKISHTEIKIVREIAQITWPVTFGEILSEKQIEYMLQMMYSTDILENQIEAGHEFYLYSEDKTPLAFLGIEANYKAIPQLKIHKLYVLPGQQGKGIGEQFIRFAEKRALELEQESLILNVNRYNKATRFYEKLGFKNIKSEDIEIGNGYLMEDFVMEKILKN